MENTQILQKKLMPLNHNGNMHGSVDILQQALAETTGDFESDSTTVHSINPQPLDNNTLYNILQNDHITHTIQLTVEQAAALGLHLETEKEELIEDEPEIIQNSTPIPIVLNSGGNVVIPSSATEYLKQLNINADKPLGTTDNPIQLVQQGNTYLSVAPLDKQQLKEIESTLHQRNSLKDSTKAQSVFDSKTNTRIVYRTVYPEDLDLQMPKKNKRGRPRKSNIVERIPSPPPVVITKSVRTRSGRVTKPPKHMINIFQTDDNSVGSEQEKVTKSTIELNVNNSIETEKQVEIISDKVFEPAKRPKIGFPETKIPKRNVAQQFRCPTCKKAYLGYARIEKHIKLNPDHGPLTIRRKVTPLWETAVRNARIAQPGRRVLALLNDLSVLVKTVQKECTSLLQPVSSENVSKVEVDEYLSLLLNVPVGFYTIDENQIFGKKSRPTEKIAVNNGIENNVNEIINQNIVDQNVQNQNVTEQNGIENHQSENLEEQLLNVNMDSNSESNELIMPVDTGQRSVLDSSGASDDIMNVDQLVSERLENMTAAELAPPISNSALGLDLIDLFQFNPS